jgi:hypothetical protein
LAPFLPGIQSSMTGKPEQTGVLPEPMRAVRDERARLDRMLEAVDATTDPVERADLAMSIADNINGTATPLNTTPATSSTAPQIEIPTVARPVRARTLAARNNSILRWRRKTSR